MKTTTIHSIISATFKKELNTKAEINQERNKIVASFPSGVAGVKGGTPSSFASMMLSICKSYENWPMKDGAIIPLGSISLEKTRNDEVAKFTASDTFKAVNAFASWVRCYYELDLTQKVEKKKPVAIKPLTEADLEPLTMATIVKKAQARGLEVPVSKSKAKLIKAVLTEQAKQPKQANPAQKALVERVKAIRTALEKKRTFEADVKAKALAHITDALQILEAAMEAE